MKYQILVIQPILPRSPIGLISLGLGSSLKNVRIKEEFSYKPLALFFRRAREHAAELIRPTRYASQDGTNITVAPRFEFTIYLASNLKSLPDYQQMLGHQNWSESNDVSTILSPPIAGNFQGAAKSNEPQWQRKIGGRLWMPSSRSTHYPMLKQTLGHSYLSLKIVRNETESIKNHDQSERDGKFLFSFMTQSDHIGRSFTRSLLKRQWILTRSTPAGFRMPCYQEEHFIPKEAGFGWSLYRRNHLLGATSTANYPFLALKSEFLLSAISKVVRQTTTSLTQQNVGKLDEVYSREDSHSRNLLATQISASKDGKHLSPISEFHQASQFVPEETNFERKMHRKNRLLEAASTVNYPILASKPQLLSGAIRKVLRSDITIFDQQNIWKRNKIYLKADFSFIRSLTPSIFTSKDAKPLGSIESLDFRLPGRQPVRQRESGDSQERLIPPAQLSYRSEKKLQPTSVTAIAEPASASLPINTPKIDIDRLSRDVWNQLEKRIRIERERHGRL